VPAAEKRIAVYLGGQYVTAYESGQPVFTVRVSTGGIFRSGRYTTPIGNFTTYYKRPTRHMASGDVAADGYDLPGVPWVSYITESGIGFHGTYWHNEFGRPRSHGCINLTPQSAKWLYRWTLPAVHPAEESAYQEGGTRVEIVA
jgi:lipoprotein-anchoring transpeptidase ErfK/SrfK